MAGKIRLSNIVELVEKFYPHKDTGLVERAYVYSAKVHQGQLRKSGEPYLTHPLAVAHILATKGMEPAVVAAGLLHDTIEDTWATSEDIEDNFGNEVKNLVDGVTKLSQFHSNSKEERQIRSFRKLILASIDDPRTLVIKLADRLHNMRTIGSMKEASQRRIAYETLHIYAVIAHRLGMQAIQDELQDRSFAVLEPKISTELGRMRDKLISHRTEYNERIIGALEEAMASDDIDAKIYGRIKHIYSIHKKMTRDKCRFEELYDIVAYRIIVDNVGECYRAMGIVHALWQPRPGRIKDYIAAPKNNGYRSLHTTVLGREETLIEVQIRTPEMHHYAEEGIAAHWAYKEGITTDEQQAQVYQLLRQVLDSADSSERPEAFFEKVRDGLKEGQLFAFTPKGDVMELDDQATVLDFAYRVHTDVGHRCTGALVNGKWVPVRHKLKNGDVVSIQTQAGHIPKRDWLNIVVTRAAKTKIRTFLKERENEEAVRQGRDLLERQVRNLAGPRKKLSHKDLTLLARNLGVNDTNRLFAWLGNGKLAPNQVREKLTQVMGVESREKGIRLPVPEGLTRWMRRSSKEQPDLIVAGENGLMLRLAKCCKPIQGDDVVGFITRGRGITVHRANCGTVATVDQARLLATNWGSDPSGSKLHTVRLRVVMKDQPGVLAKISQAIARLGVNIVQTNVNTTAEAGEGYFVVHVKNRSQLDRVVQTLRKTKGVAEAERIS